MNAFCNEAVAIFCENALLLREKIFHTSFKVRKIRRILKDLSKFSKIMHHYAFFFLRNYALGAKLCDLASVNVHNSGVFLREILRSVTAKNGLGGTAIYLSKRKWRV